jgi:hypothetical protein
LRPVLPAAGMGVEAAAAEALPGARTGSPKTTFR